MKHSHTISPHEFQFSRSSNCSKHQLNKAQEQGWTRSSIQFPMFSSACLLREKGRWAEIGACVYRFDHGNKQHRSWVLMRWGLCGLCSKLSINGPALQPEISTIVAEKESKTMACLWIWLSIILELSCNSVWRWIIEIHRYNTRSACGQDFGVNLHRFYFLVF